MAVFEVGFPKIMMSFCLVKHLNLIKMHQDIIHMLVISIEPKNDIDFPI